MKCLLLGGGGFLGLNLARALLREGHEVRIFDLPASILRLRRLGLPDLEWAEGDFANEREVTAALEGVNAVFHLVSTTLPKSSNDNPGYDVESNVVSTIHMLEAALKAGVHRVLFASSGGTVYGVPSEVPIKETHPTDPTCSYGIGKLAIEKYLQLFHSLHGLEYRVLRIANPYGEEQRPVASQGAVAVFLCRAANGEPIEIWGDGSVVRDFLHVDDVSQAFIRALGHGGELRLFNIGSGRGYSINELLEAIEAVVERPVIRRYLPARGFDVPTNVLDIARSREVLGFQPTTSLHDGLTRTLNWLRASGLAR
jgi:UDP-glucose 4-epimerase